MSSGSSVDDKKDSGGTKSRTERFRDKTGSGQNRRDTWVFRPRSLEESETKPFIETWYSLGAFLLLSSFMSFAMFDLVDRSPLPTEPAEVTRLPSLNLDLSMAPGYTISDIHHIDNYLIVLHSLAVGVLFILMISTLGHWLIILIERVNTKETYDERRLNIVIISAIFGIIYILVLTVILEHSHLIDYYPKPAFKYNSNIEYNKTLFGKKNYSPRETRFQRKPFAAVLVIQFLFMFIATFFYSHKLLPNYVNDSDIDKLQTYSDLWWKYTQIVLSIGVALAVGLIIPFSMNYTPYGRFGLIDVSVLAFSGLGAILIFSIIKIRHIKRKMIMDEQSDDEEDEPEEYTRFYR